MSCETRVTCTYAGKLESASNLTNPGLGETAWDVQAKQKREHAKTHLRVHSYVLPLDVVKHRQTT